jgi:hypothetical protein
MIYAQNVIPHYSVNPVGNMPFINHTQNNQLRS